MLEVGLALGVGAVLTLSLALGARGVPGALARRSLANIRPSLLSAVMASAVFGVTLAVASLTIVTAIASGFQTEFRRRILGVNAHVIVLRYGFAEYRRYTKSIEQLPGVSGVSPFVLNEMMLVSDRRLAGILLKGVDVDRMPTVLDVPDYLEAGDLSNLAGGHSSLPAEPVPTWLTPWDVAEDDGTSASSAILDDAVAEALGIVLDDEATTVVDLEQLPGIVVGRTLARELDLDLGDRVRVVSPLSGLEVSLFASEAHSTRSREFRVDAIFHSGFDEYDRRLAIVGLREAQTFSRQGDVATGLELRLDDAEDAPAFAAALDQQLRSEGFQVIDWSELNGALFAALALQKLGLILIVSALVMVAGLLIVATMVLLISEKKKEIAILKAIGAHDSSLLRAFVLIGASLGSVGTFLGVSLGFAVCAGLEHWGWGLDPGVYVLDQLPIAVDPTDAVIISAVAMVTTLIAAAVPAWLTAAKMRPVDGLADE